MAQRRELINLFIENASNTPITLPIFKKGVPSVNATRKWSWNTSSGSFSCGQISIVINNQLYQLVYDGTLGLNGAIQALNGLGFGFFSYEVILGVTYLYTMDNTNTYGIVNFCDPTPTTTTTTTSTTTTTTTIAQIYNISNTSAVQACSQAGTWNGTVTFSGLSATFCDSTGLTITSNTALFDLYVPNNTFFYLSDGIQSRYYQRSGLTFNATAIAACAVCGGATTTTTTTTTTTSTTTTTTTLAPYLLGYNASNCTSACTAVQNNYYAVLSPQLGVTLYQDAGLTTPAVNGKYSDGVNCYTVSGGAGLITAVSACVITYNISIDSSVDACSALGSYSTNTITFTGGSLTFCNSTGLTILTDKPTFDTYVGNNGFFWLSDGTNYRYYQRTGITYNCVAQDLGCTLC